MTGFASVYVHVLCMSGALEGQMWASDPLELESEAVMRQHSHVGAGNHRGSSARAARAVTTERSVLFYLWVGVFG